MKANRLFVVSALLLAVAVSLTVAPNAHAIKWCTECTVNDPCNLRCYTGGPIKYSFCEEYICSGMMVAQSTFDLDEVLMSEDTQENDGMKEPERAAANEVQAVDDVDQVEQTRKLVE